MKKIRANAIEHIIANKELERGDCEVSAYYNNDCKIEVNDHTGVTVIVKDMPVLQNLQLEYIDDLIEGLRHANNLLTKVK